MDVTLNSNNGVVMVRWNMLCYGEGDNNQGSAPYYSYYGRVRR